MIVLIRFSKSNFFGCNLGIRFTSIDLYKPPFYVDYSLNGLLCRPEIGIASRPFG